MVLDTHPLEKSSFLGFNQLPTQALSLKDKLKNKKANQASDWEIQNLDALESIAWQQYMSNYKYVINEKIVNGEFIANDYFECEGDFIEPLEQLIKEGKIPKFIKNYNIVAKIINSLVAIFEEYPDVFHIVGHGEEFQSEKGRKQTELLREWFDAKLEESINSILEPLAEEVSPEEQQAYQQQRQELKNYMTPEDIGQYMVNFRHDYELWAEYKNLDYKYKYNLPKLRKTEYRDFLINGLRARHFRITPYGLMQESINPRNLFYQKSTDVDYIQDGDYAGLIYSCSGQRFIDLFGKFISSDQVKNLNSFYSEFNPETKGVATDVFGNRLNFMPINGVPFNKTGFYNNAHLNSIAPKLGMNYSLGQDPFTSNGSGTNIYSKDIIVTEAYWKSQEKVWTLNWINPETNIQEIIEVDEEFVFPSYIKKITNISSIGEIKFNTAIESWNTVVYKGIKAKMPDGESLYFNTGICEYQKTSPNQVVPKLPIFGQTANNRNVEVRGLVDTLKPYIFLHNIAMNKAAKLQERGYLPFVVMDMKIIPRQKDWGDDEESVSKWLGIGEELGIAPIDTSVTNTQGDPNNGGQFPRVIDMDLTPRIIEQLKIAQTIVTVAYEEIGISPQLLGKINSTDSATGINAGIIQSQNSITHWVSSFFECEKELVQYSLEVAQWLEANNKEISVEYVNSDYTTGLLKLANTNFNLFDWRIYVVNSQEELRRKKIFNDLALNMNTLPLSTSDRLEMTSTTTPTEKIVKIIKASEEKAQQQQQQQLELQQQQIAAQTKAEQDKLVHAEKMLKLRLASEEEQSWIKSRGYIGAGEQDLDTNAIPDAFEYQKFQTQSSRELEKLGLSRDKVQLDREKETSRKSEVDRKMQLEAEKLRLKNKQIDQTAKNVKILDD